MRSGPVMSQKKDSQTADMRSGPVKKEPKEPEVSDEALGELVCDECGKEAKSKAGLVSHKRSHE